MADRWQPSRAGILNVYQYGDETLHFAGGRLLLRGVNGSGKSTAMNMLLPFLLEADPRRIDAAGEQTGVLKSWMLADNDETQRTGYLWIEFSRPDRKCPGRTLHHTVGCGIRANRNTDRATPWWFSTRRRARIDFALTQQNVPLSVDALRAELGAGAVFTDVADYRAEISRTFFGGADPSGYFSLLHQVRNPRIGDRIDKDLPQRLREALPPVPEEAVNDAAQPLEDLEDHRRNVLALERTERALGSVLDTYRQYARRALGQVVDEAATRVGDARSALRRRGQRRAAADQAAAHERDVQQRITALEDQDRTTEALVAGLKESPAYKERLALLARRDVVVGLRRAADGDAAREIAARQRVAGAVGVLADRRRELETDLAALAERLVDVARQAGAAAVTLPLPPLPVLRLVSRMDDGSGTAVDVPDPDADPLTSASPDAAMDAARAHRTRIAAVAARLRAADDAAGVARRADAEADTAGSQADEAHAEAAEAHERALVAADAHRAAVRDWTDGLTRHVADVPAATPDGSSGWLPGIVVPEEDAAGAAATARARVAAATATARGVDQALEPVIADAAILAGVRAAERDELAAELDAVRAVAQLPLPRGSWQADRPADPALLGALVDFRDDVPEVHRAGVEAALQASGLLSAAVSAEGALVSAAGELIVCPGPPVAENVGRFLLAAPLDDAPVGPETVRGVLEHIGLGRESGAALWVDVDGRFGAGSVTGWHTKDTAEHVGAGSRAAARERRIAELTSRLAASRIHADEASAVLVALRRHRTELHELARRIPGTGEVDEATAEATARSRAAVRAADRAAQLRASAAAAGRAAEEAWAAAQTAAADAGLPAEGSALESAAAATAEVIALLRGVPQLVDTARRAQRACDAGLAAWQHECSAYAATAEAARTSGRDAEQAAAELAGIEAGQGVEPGRVAQQVVEAEQVLVGVRRTLTAARKDHTTAVAATATARAQVDGAERDAAESEARCAAARARLQAVTQVPGLHAAALRTAVEPAPRPPEFPATPDTVEGTAELVTAVRGQIAQPDREVGDDALDRSLRAIRDALGAGWDAEARRGTGGLPAAVEVSGPYGRRALVEAEVQVGVDLRRARGLLTAKQDQALRNLLHGRIAREVASALFHARELIRAMDGILKEVTTSQGIGVMLTWRARGDLAPATATALELLGKDPEARTPEEDDAVRAAVSLLVDDARAADPEASYRTVIGEVLDYRRWHELGVHLRRPGHKEEKLTRRTRLSEGEKKLVSYLPMAAAAAASATAHDPHRVGAPRLLLLDDAFAKVSEDNHARLFGLLVDLDLDFVVTSERLWGTHAAVPELAITEVLRDPDLRTVALVHHRWDGARRTELVS